MADFRFEESLASELQSLQQRLLREYRQVQVSDREDGGRMFAERPRWNLMNKSWMLAPIQMCKYWSSKRCVMGDDCNFAHSSKELRVADLTATQLCYAFSRTGRCSKGDTCTFAHGQKELRPVPLCREKEHRVKEEQIYLETLADTLRLKSHLINFSDLSDLSFRPPPGLDFPGLSYQCQSPLGNEDASFASQSTRSDSEDSDTSPTFWL
eukprot:symbB.v1.2.027011.t1/scaffold2631.1/size74421/6